MFVRSAIILESRDRLVDVTGGVLVELLVVTKNDDGHVDRAQDRELVGLLEQSALTLEEGYRPVAVVLDGLDLDLATTHGGRV